MARLVKSAARYLAGEVGPKSRVLLINPPVHERRYHWLRWNQPAELLRLSTWLKKQSPKADIRLYDFMFADASGAVPKHKVKETWGGDDEIQLWHFGHPFEVFEDTVTKWLTRERWQPDLVIVSSLTSYWHNSIEKLLIKLCTRLGSKGRGEARLCLYGNYPKFESEHASEQRDADIAFTDTVDTSGLMPDFGLYLRDDGRPPLFYGLDIDDAPVGDHLSACVEFQAQWSRQQRIARPPTLKVAFLNEDICSAKSQWDSVIPVAQAHPKQIYVEGIVGVEPRSLTKSALQKLKAAGVCSLFVEHARTAGGDLDVSAYTPLLDMLDDEEHAKQSGASTSAWLNRGRVTGFVAMGLPDDDMDCLVRSTLRVNQFFQAVILKPFGYSPKIDPADARTRRGRWRSPGESSPQRFPYADAGRLSRGAYDDLIRWQNVLNKRVKGATFDFLARGTVAKLVRETIVQESWKRHTEVR